MQCSVVSQYKPVHDFHCGISLLCTVTTNSQFNLISDRIWSRELQFHRDQRVSLSRLVLIRVSNLGAVVLCDFIGTVALYFRFVTNLVL